MSEKSDKKVRGRRSEKKEKAEESPAFFIDNGPQQPTEPSAEEIKTPFFGLVDSTELDYFKQAEKTLNIDAFEDSDDREGFIRSVLEEAKGKELKLVTNQICSKLMERLVLFSSDAQLKRIFKLFSGHFVPLAHHKYASHVLETILVRSAALIEKELKGLEVIVEEVNDDDETENVITMETLFIKMLNEYKTHIKAMINHQYSSHVLRLILLILSGRALPSSTMSNSVLRSKKSKIARKMIEIKDNDDFNKSFEVPPTFKIELKDVCHISLRNLNTQQLRSFSIDKIASPVVQLLLQIEGIVDKERAIWHVIFLKHDAPADPKEEAFVEHLLSDAVGSHFLEAAIKNDGVRLRYIERLYELYMKNRIVKLVRRATTGVYIVQALLFKLKPKEVEFIIDEIVPELPQLVSMENNENLDLCVKLIDASKSRFNYQRDEIIKQLFAKFDPKFQYQQVFKLKFINYDDSTDLFENVLQLRTSTLGNTRDDWPTALERKRSLFLEKLMEYDSAFVVDVWLNILSLPKERFIQMCLHGVFSHIIEHAMVVSNPETKAINIVRKRFLNLFQGNIMQLSCNSTGSHIVDKLWHFTVFLPQYKDKTATELVKESSKVKESTYGKMVWKNWTMDLFIRKKFDWKALIKAQELEFLGEPAEGEERAKRPIDVKMAQLAEEREKVEEKKRKAEEDAEKEERKRLRGRR